VQRIIVGGLKEYFRTKSRRTALRRLQPIELRLAVSGPDARPIAALLVYVDQANEDAARLLFEPYWQGLAEMAATELLTLMPARYGDDESFSSGDLRSSGALRLPG
jgi:hypothetical protein